jgi:hypothetical protein
MSKRSKKDPREPQPKQARAVPPGYLPTADPPRRRPALLAISAAILALWLVMLAWMAIFG